MKISAVALVYALLTVAGQTIDVFARSMTSNQKLVFGEITYDPASNSTLYNAKIESLPQHETLCLGTKDLPQSECFFYLETFENPPSGDFVVFVDDAGQLSHLTVEIHNQGKWGVQSRHVSKGPEPNLNPINRQQVQKEPVKQKIVTKRTTTKVENGETIEVEEEVTEEVEEDTRSWVQKNWMYIVIPLLIILVMSPEEEKK